MIKYPQLLALDLDGVVVDSFGIHVVGWKAVLERVDADPDSNLFDDLRGVPTRDAIQSLLRHAAATVTPSLFEELVQLKCTIRDRLIGEMSGSDILPGAIDLLHEAGMNGVRRLCVATTTAAPRILQRVGLRQYFEDVLFGTSFRVPKSSSALPLLNYLDEHDVAATSCVYVDDGAAAVRTALALGIPALWLIASPLNGTLTSAHLPQLYESGLRNLELARSAQDRLQLRDPPGRVPPRPLP